MQVVRGMTDLARVRSAIRKVLLVARDESIAMTKAIERHPHDVDVLALRAAHLAELDAIQALQSALDLFEKRLPDIERALADSGFRDD